MGTQIAQRHGPQMAPMTRIRTATGQVPRTIASWARSILPPGRQGRRQKAERRCKKIVVALLVAVVLGGMAIHLRSSTPATPTTTAAPAQPGVVNPPEPPPVDPAPYLTAFPLTPIEAPLVVGTSPAARALNAALEPYRKGDYTAAASALDGVVMDNPEDTTAVLFLGISRLFMDEPQNALEILRPLEYGTPPEVAAEAAWYSLVGIARLRDPSAVEAEARALCAKGVSSSPRACAAVERLAKSRRPVARLTSRLRLRICGCLTLFAHLRLGFDLSAFVCGSSAARRCPVCVYTSGLIPLPAELLVRV